jgi:hypothetical protein
MIPLFMMFAGGPLGSGKQWYRTQFSICFAGAEIAFLLL